MKRDVLDDGAESRSEPDFWNKYITRFNDADPEKCKVWDGITITGTLRGACTMKTVSIITSNSFNGK